MAQKGCPEVKKEMLVLIESNNLNAWGNINCHDGENEVWNQ
jgi:hypothetical protein